MTWQPIETAPKDGMPVLMYHPGWEEGERIIVLAWAKLCEAWMEPTDTESRYFNPGTHWMPLPDPPAEIEMELAA